MMVLSMMLLLSIDQFDVVVVNDVSVKFDSRRFVRLEFLETSKHSDAFVGRFYRAADVVTSSKCYRRDKISWSVCSVAKINIFRL